MSAQGERNLVIPVTSQLEILNLFFAPGIFHHIPSHLSQRNRSSNNHPNHLFSLRHPHHPQQESIKTQKTGCGMDAIVPHQADLMNNDEA